MLDHPNGDTPDESVTLYARRVAAQHALGTYATGNLKAEVTRDAMGAMVARFVTRVMTHQLATDRESVTIHVPATWWDHLKHTHAARWWARPLVRRRPPRYTAETLTVHLTRYATYPGVDAAPQHPAFGAVVLVDDTHAELAGRWATQRPILAGIPAARAIKRLRRPGAS